MVGWLARSPPLRGRRRAGKSSPSRRPARQWPRCNCPGATRPGKRAAHRCRQPGHAHRQKRDECGHVSDLPGAKGLTLRSWSRSARWQSGSISTSYQHRTADAKHLCSAATPRRVASPTDPTGDYPAGLTAIRPQAPVLGFSRTNIGPGEQARAILVPLSRPSPRVARCRTKPRAPDVRGSASLRPWTCPLGPARDLAHACGRARSLGRLAVPAVTHSSRHVRTSPHHFPSRPQRGVRRSAREDAS